MDGESTSECSGRGGGCPAGPLMRPNALYHKQLVIHRAVCQTLVMEHPFDCALLTIEWLLFPWLGAVDGTCTQVHPM